jgi:hypothetical protein
MQFKLNKLKVAPQNDYHPQESIVEYIRCHKCNTRDAQTSVGLTTRGIQIWCDTCDHNVLHIELKGDIQGDPHKHGRFNERAKRSPRVEMMNDYSLDLDGLGCITSQDLREKKIEESA